MTSSPLIVIVLLLLACGRAAWWLIASGRWRLESHVTDSQSATGALSPLDVPPAVAAYIMTGTQGRPCRLLDVGAASTVAALAERGILDVVEDGDTAVVACPRHAEPLAHVDDALLVNMLRTRMSAVRQSESLLAVDSGTLAHARPSELWWSQYRRAVARRTTELGLTTQRNLTAGLLPVIVAMGTIFVAGVLTSIGSVVSAIRSIDPSLLNLWWIVFTPVAAKTGFDAVRLLVEQELWLSEVGMATALRLDHWRDEIAGRVQSSDGVSHGRDVALAAALGVPTRIPRQIPLHGNSARRTVWSQADGTLHTIDIKRSRIPAEGTRPGHAVVWGGVSIAAALVVRSYGDRILQSDTFETMQSHTPTALSPVSSVVSAIIDLTLAPLAVGTALVIAGLVDLLIKRQFAGTVIDVRLPADHSFGGWWSAITAGAGHDGVAVVELSIERNDGGVLTVLVDARAAAPLGAHVSIERTLLLRRVRSVSPIGRSGRSEHHTHTLGV